ncbi:MAG: TetR/AcrR family transcriptional regulator [Acidimicrobiia bacterium]|nr:TetR/AcrR family transcriptional regulator [Acidimicrobiia bacterium]
MGTRSERARADVLDATIDLLCEQGLPGLTIEQVAHRSGVAKTTIYRHWATKVDLVLDAVTALDAPIATPNTGDLRADLRACFHAVSDAGLQSRLGRIVPSLLDAAQRDPEYARLNEQLGRERRQPVRTVLELAQLRGEIPASVDLDDATELVIGPLLGRVLVSREPVTEGFVELVVDTVVTGLAPRR